MCSAVHAVLVTDDPAQYEESTDTLTEWNSQSLLTSLNSVPSIRAPTSLPSFQPVSKQVFPTSGSGYRWQHFCM